MEDPRRPPERTRRPSDAGLAEAGPGVSSCRLGVTTSRQDRELELEAETSARAKATQFAMIWRVGLVVEAPGDLEDGQHGAGLGGGEAGQQTVRELELGEEGEELPLEPRLLAGQL